MTGLIDPQPVGTPGLIALMLSGVLFAVALLAARSRAKGSGSARRSARSTIGVAVQGLGIAVGAYGPIVIGLKPDSTAALLQALLVLALMLGAAGLFHASARTMGRNWSIVARTREDHELVTGGPFALVRHPIYVAMFLCQLGIATAFGHWRGLVLGVPLYWLGTWLRVIEEEKLLRAQFGAAYDAYAARVKRFVPGIV